MGRIHCMNIDQRIVPTGLDRMVSHPTNSTALNCTVNDHFRLNIVKQPLRLFPIRQIRLSRTDGDRICSSMPETGNHMRAKKTSTTGDQNASVRPHEFKRCRKGFESPEASSR